MIPDPLHPAVVHLPIALAVLLPLAALGGAWAIHSERVPRRGWLGVVLLVGVLAGSAWAAVQTGEHDEERVENAVAERPIDEHEESGERFLILAALALPVSLAGLVAGPLGTAARVLTIVASLGLLGAAAVAGHSGGELVYRHGAARAYVDAAGRDGIWLRPAAAHGEEEEHEDDSD